MLLIQQNDDQLFPAYVMQTVGNYRGIPGLFIAGVFGAALRYINSWYANILSDTHFRILVHSSLSVVLNSTAGVLLEDIFKGCFKGRPSEASASMIVKGSILVLGCLAMILLMVVDKLGGILEVRESAIHLRSFPLNSLLVCSWRHRYRPSLPAPHSAYSHWACWIHTRTTREPSMEPLPVHLCPAGFRLAHRQLLRLAPL